MSFADRGHSSLQRVIQRFGVDCTVIQPGGTFDPDTGAVSGSTVSMELRVTIPAPSTKLINGQLVSGGKPEIYIDADDVNLTVAPEEGFTATVLSEDYLVTGVQKLVANDEVYGYVLELGGTN